MGWQTQTSKKNFHICKAAKGTRLSQWQKWNSNITAVGLCSLTRDLPSTREPSQLLLRDFPLPWQAWKWSGSTLQQNWHHHCQCLAFHSTPLLEMIPIAVQDAQKQKYLPLSSEWIPTPEITRSKKWGRHELSEISFSEISFLSSLQFPSQQNCLVSYNFIFLLPRKCWVGEKAL